MKINQLLFILLILFLQSTAFAEEKYIYLQGQSEYPVREYERNGNIMGMIPISAKVKILRSGNDSVVVEYAPRKENCRRLDLGTCNLKSPLLTKTKICDIGHNGRVVN